jgi:hypothetical protein
MEIQNEARTRGVLSPDSKHFKHQCHIYGLRFSNRASLKSGINKGVRPRDPHIKMLSSQKTFDLW